MADVDDFPREEMVTVEVEVGDLRQVGDGAVRVVFPIFVGIVRAIMRMR